MREWEEKVIEWQKGFEEGQVVGKAEGLEEGKNDLLQSLVKKKLDKNYSKEEIADMLEEDVAIIERIISELQQMN